MFLYMDPLPKPKHQKNTLRGYDCMKLSKHEVELRSDRGDSACWRDTLSLVEGYIGALIIRIGFWGPLFFVIIRNPQDSIGNY